jgi:hypothetical protein
MSGRVLKQLECRCMSSRRAFATGPESKPPVTHFGFRSVPESDKETLGQALLSVIGNNWN